MWQIWFQFRRFCAEFPKLNGIDVSHVLAGVLFSAWLCNAVTSLWFGAVVRKVCGFGALWCNTTPFHKLKKKTIRVSECCFHSENGLHQSPFRKIKTSMNEFMDVRCKTVSIPVCLWASHDETRKVYLAEKNPHGSQMFTLTFARIRITPDGR